MSNHLSYSSNNTVNGNPSPVSMRVRLAGGMIAAAVAFGPMAGALRPAHAGAIPPDPVTTPTSQPTALNTAPETGLKADPQTDPQTKKDTTSLVGRRRTGVAAVTLTRTQIGKPYVWGATGPDSFDCSGLVQWAYKKVGINIPRVTYDQYAQIDKKVTWNDLGVGDLVFFSNKGHVGIISKRTGDELWMIHAPYTGSYVKEDKLNEHRRQTFAGAVRPF